MTTAPNAHRGSRKHVLDWTARCDFLTEFAELVALPGASMKKSRCAKEDAHE